LRARGRHIATILTQIYPIASIAGQGDPRDERREICCPRQLEREEEGQVEEGQAVAGRGAHVGGERAGGGG